MNLRFYSRRSETRGVMTIERFKVVEAQLRSEQRVSTSPTLLRSHTPTQRTWKLIHHLLGLPPLAGSYTRSSKRKTVSCRA